MRGWMYCTAKTQKPANLISETADERGKLQTSNRYQPRRSKGNETRGRRRSGGHEQPSIQARWKAWIFACGRS